MTHPLLSDYVISRNDYNEKELVRMVGERREETINSQGFIVVNNYPYTGRSPKDRFIVKNRGSRLVDFNHINQPMSQKDFDTLLEIALSYAQEKELFSMKGYAGASPTYRVPIEVVTEDAWQSLFAHEAFFTSDITTPELTIISLPHFNFDPSIHPTNSEVFIGIDLQHHVVLIVGTKYAGEIKKSVFSFLNYIYPQQHIFPMHCAASTYGSTTALFFGLSGTGKTTLSMDPSMSLVGDDEHGWSEEGIFNFEAFSYAKVNGINSYNDPIMWSALHPGTIIENAVESSELDFANESISSNIRASLPLSRIHPYNQTGLAGIPKVIFFLSADAWGVLPPVAKLTYDQAVFYFLSGYTSKTPGTERGIMTPIEVFSACFAAPFIPQKPVAYAEMLREKLERYQPDVYLINTGWTGGPYGIGTRIRLVDTKKIIEQAIQGNMAQAKYVIEPVFHLAIPEQVQGVEKDLLNPIATWSDSKEYLKIAHQLRERFVDNIHRLLGDEVHDYDQIFEK